MSLTLKKKLQLIAEFLDLGFIEDPIDYQLIEEENKYLSAENEALWKALRKAHDRIISLKSELRL